MENNESLIIDNLEMTFTKDEIKFNDFRASLNSDNHIVECDLDVEGTFDTELIVNLKIVCKRKKQRTDSKQYDENRIYLLKND